MPSRPPSTSTRVLRHLNRSPMRPYLRRVHTRLPELDAFLMAYLRYPTSAEKEQATWIPDLGCAMRTLHAVTGQII